MHRLTGLGVVFFLILHVIDTSWAVFYPGLYEKAISIYQTPLFTIGEFGLVFAVVYHAFNGLRIAVFDFKPEWWKHQERAAWGVFGATILLLVPVFIGMALHVVNHYAHDPFVLPMGEALVEQLPFLAGMVVAAIFALVLSGLYGLVNGNESSPISAKASGSKVERFWWSFMRVSGLLIIPLVFGHLAMMHVIRGVFDINVAEMAIVGTMQTGDLLTAEALTEALDGDDLTLLLNGWNDTGTATEFVAERWNMLVGGVAIWRAYDIALLALVTIHGFNGLRYVLTDYTMGNPLLRRASVILTFIGALALLIVGGAALLSSIGPDSIRTAENALRALRAAHS